jgi:ABC-type uncharacterized transport system YnjBCD ATPase subunit
MIISFTIIVPIMGAYRSNRYELKYLMKSGLETDAEILEYIIIKSSDSYTVIVSFRFVDILSQKLVTYKKIVGKNLNLSTGTKIKVRYNKKFPFLCALVPHGLEQNLESEIIHKD